MSKLIYLVCLFACVSLMFSCGDGITMKSVTPYNNEVELVREYVPSTKAFAQGAILDEVSVTRYGAYGNRWPNVNVEEYWESARFSIRIDGKIVGVEDQTSAKYWGGFEGPNLGKVSSLASYGRYDDRGFDYYKKDTKTGNNVGLFRYMHDPNGVLTELVITEKPDVVEFLTYWYNKETSETKNKQMLKEAIDGLSNGSLKVIWYVVKEVGMQYGWHVNGVLRENDDAVVDIPKVKDEVEVDVHMQEHMDWNEIKTSIHVRSEEITSLSVNIPIKYSNIVEKDDFSIRAFDYEFSYLTVGHSNNGITIFVDYIDPTFIKYLKENYGDGLTIEVHSYARDVDGVWEDMKNTTVSTDKPCSVKGQVTNAFDDDSVDLSN